MIFFVLFVALLCSSTSAVDPMLEMVQKENFPIERHFVSTADGYILGLYRLARNSSVARKPILLMHVHGLLSSSMDFVLYRNSSTGYFFYDHGYDFWMGNARGNTFSRNHTRMNPDEAAFWNFSWHEIGVYDLAAIIDFILASTGQKQLIYAGHSQGGAIMCVLLSERREYNEKVSSVHLMANSVVTTHFNQMFYPALLSLDYIQTIVETIGFFEILSFHEYRKLIILIGELCSLPFISPMCKFSTELFIGTFAPNSYYDDVTKDSLIIHPNGASYKQLIHYGQTFISSRFQKFDFGTVDNMKRYGTEKPPEYKLSNIKTKVHIIYGMNDRIIMPKNIPPMVERLKKAVVAVNKVNFNHMNFIIGRLVHAINPIILRVIRNTT